MLVPLIIGGTVVLVTFFAGFFDYLGKRQARRGGSELEARVAALEQKLADQEQNALEREELVRRLEGEVSFMTNLLEARNK